MLAGQVWSSLQGLAAQLPKLLEEVQTAIWERAVHRLKGNSVDVTSLDDLKEAFEGHPVFASAPFCNTEPCEIAIKGAVHAVTVRNLRSDRKADGAPCLACGQPAEHVALIARSY